MIGRPATRLLLASAISVSALAFVAWQMLHRDAAADESSGSDGNGGQLIIIPKDDPDWETKLEQVLTEAGHPDVAGAMETARADRNGPATGPGE